MKLAVTIFIFMLSVWVVPLHAQQLQSLGNATGSIFVKTNPPRPRPHQTVTVTVESYAMDLDRATISWYLNNTLVQEALGKKIFTFKTGSLGSTSSILIVIQSPGGAPIQETLVIHPATVDLITEAQSYTPPFYRGKAMYPYQGTVKVIAVPHIITENGGAVNPKTLIYDWKVDGNPAQDASGYGKNVIFFDGGVPLKPAVISVEVSSVDQTYTAGGSTTLTPVQPGIVLYEENPLMGTLYNKALPQTVRLTDEEIKIVAVPYFMGAREKEKRSLSYSWQLNNETIPAGEGKNNLSFKQEKGASGAALVFTKILNPDKTFQYAEINTTLLFGDKAF